MLVENPTVCLLGYYLGLLGMFGIGFEFVALKIPDFINSLGRKKLLEILIAFLNSWQLGFLLIFVATQYLGGVLGDMLFFLGLGIAIPDIPARFRRYWKYLIAIISLAGVLPGWLADFLATLEAGKSVGEVVKEIEEKVKEERREEEEIKWEEPKYVE